MTFLVVLGTKVTVSPTSIDAIPACVSVCGSYRLLLTQIGMVLPVKYACVSVTEKYPSVNPSTFTSPNTGRSDVMPTEVSSVLGEAAMETPLSNTPSGVCAKTINDTSSSIWSYKLLYRSRNATMRDSASCALITPLSSLCNAPTSEGRSAKSDRNASEPTITNPPTGIAEISTVPAYPSSII